MTVLRSEAREVLAWCLTQPGWWRTRDVADHLGYSLDAALKQMRRLDDLNVVQRGELNGRTPLWRIRDRELAETLAAERPGPKKNGYVPKGRAPKSTALVQIKAPYINSVWSLAHVNRTE